MYSWKVEKKYQKEKPKPWWTQLSCTRALLCMCAQWEKIWTINCDKRRRKEDEEVVEQRKHNTTTVCVWCGFTMHNVPSHACLLAAKKEKRRERCIGVGIGIGGFWSWVTAQWISDRANYNSLKLWPKKKQNRSPSLTNGLRWEAQCKHTHTHTPITFRGFAFTQSHEKFILSRVLFSRISMRPDTSNDYLFPVISNDLQKNCILNTTPIGMFSLFWQYFVIATSFIQSHSRSSRCQVVV